MAYFNAVYQSDLSHRARAVYMYLKDRSDAEGQCWPAIKTIGAELGLSRSTVNLVFLSALKLLEQLTEKGLLTVDEAEKSRIELERKLRPTLLFA